MKPYTRKFFVILLMCSCALAAAFAFAGCKTQSECETHIYGDWVIVTEPDCGDDGVKKHTCTVCGHSETAAVPKAGEHSVGTWTQDKAGTCKDKGTEKGTCSVCGHEVSRETSLNPANHSEWTEWVVDAEADCAHPGSKFRVCLGCGVRDEAIIPEDDTKHVYGSWTQSLAPLCNAEGIKFRICSECGAKDTQSIPPDTTKHDFGAAQIEKPSTCTVAGVTAAVCSRCGESKKENLPLDTHNHWNTGADGVCTDCKGLLSQDIVVDNSAGKDVNAYVKYYEGDFKAVYEFDAKAGVDPVWDNFILCVSPAEYLDGKLVRTRVGEVMLLPFPSDNYEQLYGKLWTYKNNSYTTTWFFDENGTDLIYQDCVTQGVKVKITLVKKDGALFVTMVLTVEKNGKYYDCTVNSTLNFPGIDKLYIGLTGEDSRLTLNQVNILEGKFAEETREESSTALIGEPAVYDNKNTKNAKGINYSFEGDFDLEYRFTMDGNPDEIWHSWIFYVFNGRENLSLGGGGKLFWAGAANGWEPENYAPAYHDVNGWFLWNSGDFARKSASSDVTLRMVRKDGLMTLYGTAYYNGEQTPFANWTFSAFTENTGLVTVRITSENSTIHLKEVLLYNGRAMQTNRQCVLHELGNWTTVTAPDCGEAGLEKRECGLCDYSETRAIPAEREHEYGAWVTVTEPTCGEAGTKKHTCTLCGHSETDSIPPASEHAYGAWTTERTATCSQTGLSYTVCSQCGNRKEQVLPIDIYKHNTPAGEGACADCGGMLDSAKTLNNLSGKAIESFSKYYDGDFKAEYVFKSNCGSDANWHNFILTVGAAEYLNGELVRTGIGEIMLIPFHPGNLDAHYGAFWTAAGNSFDIGWFHDETGAEHSFQECMKLDPDVVLTVEKIGAAVTVKILMTVEKDGLTVTCPITATLNFSGARRIFVSLTGESNTVELKQAKLLSGSFAAGTLTEQAESLLEEPVIYTNADGAKNVEGFTYTFGNNLDLEMRFNITNATSSDWHSWIFYMYEGSETTDKMWWSGAAIGAEPENYATLYHNMDFYFRRDLTSDFGAKLANADVVLRFVRTNGGYFSIFGSACASGETNPFVYWNYSSFSSYEGNLTLRVTSENSVVTMNEILLYGA